MTISSTVRKAGPFAGNDVTTAFPFTFKVFSAADVLVIRADANMAEYTLELTTDYTVSLNANQNTSPGGTVTKNTALATGDSLVITSTVGDLQPVDLTNGGGFYPDVINAALDRATIQIQQLSEKVDRSIKVTITSDLTPDEFVTELQQGASEASASAASAADSAALAATFVPAGYAQLAGADFTGPVTVATTLDVTGAASVVGLLTAGGGVEVPALASGSKAGQVQEVAPPGLLAFFARDTAPAGWLKANGAAVSRTTYAALFAAIGTVHGAGDGSTTFNLPDRRGEFLRGWDDGRGVDAGRVFGSAQSSQNLAHTHGVTNSGTGATVAGATQWVGGTPSGSHTITSSSSGGTEARPRNMADLVCIKY